MGERTGVIDEGEVSGGEQTGVIREREVNERVNRCMTCGRGEWEDEQV